MLAKDRRLSKLTLILSTLSAALASCASNNARPAETSPSTSAESRSALRMTPKGPHFDPTFMGSRERSGRSLATATARAPRARIVVAMQGRIRTQPLIGADGVLYVASDDGSVLALSPSGEERFRATLGARIRATPALADDGTLYVGTEAGELVALDESGTLLFRERVNAPILGALAIALDGTVIVAADGLYGFAPRGGLRFHWVTADPLRAVLALHPDGFVAIGTSHGTLLAVSLNGQLRWEVSAHGAIEGGVAVGSDGTLVVANTLGELLTFSPEGVLEAATVVPAAIEASPAIGHDGRVVVGTSTGIYAFTRELAPLWRVPISGPIRASVRIDAAGSVLVGSSDDFLYALSQDGALQWRYSLGSDIDAPVALAADGTLYVGTDHGGLYALH